MNDFEGTAVMVTLFLLRCIAPLAITLSVGYLMNKLVDRWRAAEELAGGEAGVVATQSVDKKRLGASLPAITIPCWLLRNCEPEMRSDCPAYNQPGIPCWLVRMTSDGALPANCPECPIYTQALALA